MTDLIEIESIPENEKTLNELQALSADLQEKGVRAALHASSIPLVKAMRSKAPDDRSTAGSRLAQAINKTQAKTGAGVITGAGGRSVNLDSGEVGLIIGPNKKVDGRSVRGVAIITEWGAKAHKISAKNNIFKIGPRIFRGTINHPGVKAQHWMSGAFTSVEGQYQEGFYRGLEKWMNKHGR